MRRRWVWMIMGLSIWGLCTGGAGILAEEKAGETAASETANAKPTSPSAQAENRTQLAIRMMEEVKRREKEVLDREERLHQEESRLKSLEEELQATIKRLMALEQKVHEDEEARLQQLAKVFESSPPEQGGKLLSNLDAKTAAMLLSRMNARKAGRLWAFVQPEKASAISDILAKTHKMKLP